MSNQREFTSLEHSTKLFNLGVKIETEEKYFWQKISSTEYQKQFEDQGTRLFVGKLIQQGSEALYNEVEIMCPAYTFQQLIDFLKVCPPLQFTGESAADQIAFYMIIIKEAAKVERP
jgi:hypothetical protein